MELSRIPKIDLPDIRLFGPTNLKEIGIERSKEMYGMVKDIGKLEFLQNHRIWVVFLKKFSKIFYNLRMKQ